MAPIITCVGLYLGGRRGVVVVLGVRRIVELHKALPLWGYFEPPAAEFLR